MKRIGCLVLLVVSVVLWSSMAKAATITLAWDSSSGATSYKLYYGLSSASYDTVVNVGNVTTTTLTDLIDWQHYYFAVTALDSAQESDYSNEVDVVVGVRRHRNYAW